MATTYAHLRELADAVFWALEKATHADEEETWPRSWGGLKARSPD